jgi:hypothetical protein
MASSGRHTPADVLAEAVVLTGYGAVLTLVGDRPHTRNHGSQRKVCRASLYQPRG